MNLDKTPKIKRRIDSEVRDGPLREYDVEVYGYFMLSGLDFAVCKLEDGSYICLEASTGFSVGRRHEIPENAKNEAEKILSERGQQESLDAVELCRKEISRRGTVPFKGKDENKQKEIVKMKMAEYKEKLALL